jgi:phosphomannomutase
VDINAAFKLFDVRGHYPSEADERLAFVIGKSLALYRRPERVLVASDTRESSPSLKNFVIDGLSICNAAVFDLFEVPISEFYYTMATQKFDLGIVVTASHVSEADNGFKFVNGNGLPFDEAEIENLKHLALRLANDPILVPKAGPTRINNTDAYVNDVLRHIPKNRFYAKFVLDVTKSSVVTPVLVAFSRLGANFALAKADNAGNPLLAEHREALVKEVLRTKADLGVMWDSDGDRVIFIDSQGKLVPVPFVLGVLAANEVRRCRGGKVSIDVRAGLVVRDLVAEAGGTVMVQPAWSQFIKFAMQTDPEIVFGGETSGHFVFKDFYGIDDGILGALKFICLWEDTPLKAKLAELDRKYFELPETNFPCPAERAPDILEKISNFYRAQDLDVSVVDGLTVFGPDYKFNLRASLTEPFLRLNLEARSQKQATEIANEIEKHLNL